MLALDTIICKKCDTTSFYDLSFCNTNSIIKRTIIIYSINNSQGSRNTYSLVRLVRLLHWFNLLHHHLTESLPRPKRRSQHHPRRRRRDHHLSPRQSLARRASNWGNGIQPIGCVVRMLERIGFNHQWMRLCRVLGGIRDWDGGRYYLLRWIKNFGKS